MSAVSELLKRNPRGLNMEQIAKEVGLNHRNSLAHYVRNPGRITFGLARKLAASAGVPVKTLVSAAMNDIKATKT